MIMPIREKHFWHMFLSLQMVFNFVAAATVFTAREIISILAMSLLIIKTRYLNCFTTLSFWLQTYLSWKSFLDVHHEFHPGFSSEWRVPLLWQLDRLCCLQRRFVILLIALLFFKVATQGTFKEHVKERSGQKTTLKYSDWYVQLLSYWSWDNNHLLIHKYKLYTCNGMLKSSRFEILHKNRQFFRNVSRSERNLSRHVFYFHIHITFLSPFNFITNLLFFVILSVLIILRCE